MMDKCEVCKGFGGGIVGNENILYGVRICDYCYATVTNFLKLVDAKKLRLVKQNKDDE